MRTVRTKARARGVVTFLSVITAMAVLIRVEVDSLTRAAADMHASVSDRNITVTVTPSQAPEEVVPNKGTTQAPPVVNPLSASGATTWFGKQTSKRPKSVDDAWDLPYGEDISVAVDDLLEFPYRTIVHIESTIGQCTGGLYGPGVVLTAGHCVFKGSWARNVKVIAARRSDGSSQFDACEAVALFTTEGWKSNEDEEYDYGAIRLNCSVGSKAGWLGYGWKSNAALVKTPTTVAGYRSEYVFATGKTRRLMRWGPGEVKVFVEPLLFYDNSTQPMQSGAPLLADDPASGRIIGVHAQGCHQLTAKSQDCRMTDPSPHGSWNHGTLVTREVFQNMKAWRTVSLP